MTSKIKVDNIENQCGGAVVTKCGGTTTISGTVVKANNIQAADGGNLVNQCGTTITLGASGDTINLASGASQSGFGRTGTVDWQTGSIKTSTFTAANGEGYFANTSGGAFTMNLPAGSAGAIVSVVDYTNTFQTNALTVAPNGSEKIGGIAASNTLSTEGQSITLVYVDATEGWKNVHDSTSNITGNPFLAATGGTITTSGNCKIHTFTGPGTFTVSNASATAAENIVSYLVVAGGASGGASDAGGGGAGGFRELKSPLTPYTASPLDGYPSAPNRITVTTQSYPIIVGGGGAAITGPTSFKGNNGSVSTFSTITSTGGGGGAANASPAPGNKGQDGGSGGGGGRDGSPGNCAGAGNTPPVSPPQGNPGGTSPTAGWTGGGGGGGATAVGTGGSGGSPGSEVAGNGGAGATTSINGTPTARAGGGGGSAAGQSPSGAGVGGAGGGGQGGTDSGPAARGATAGTVNTGGGGGGDHGPNSLISSGAGGSGIVIIRYKFQ